MEQQSVIKGAILAFGIWTLFSIGTDLVYDRLVAIGLLLILLKLQITWKPWTVWTAVGAILLHNSYLYGNTYVVPFDKIMHTVGAFAAAAILYQILRHQKNTRGIVLWTILITMGIASLHEIIEFIGYSQLGHGDGIFYFGVGDFGEWNNTIWDLISNLIGSIIGALTLHYPYMRKKS